MREGGWSERGRVERERALGDGTNLIPVGPGLNSSTAQPLFERRESIAIDGLGSLHAATQILECRGDRAGRGARLQRYADPCRHYRREQVSYLHTNACIYAREHARHARHAQHARYARYARHAHMHLRTYARMHLRLHLNMLALEHLRTHLRTHASTHASTRARTAPL